MSISSFDHQMVVSQVTQLIASGRITPSQRRHWEEKLLANPRAIDSLHLERPITHELNEPAPDASYVEPQSGGQTLQEWISEQPEIGQPAAGTPPTQPTYASPTVTVSGIDLAAVKRLDPRVRAAVAREPDRGKAAEMIERFSGPDAALEVDIAIQSGGEAYEDHVVFGMELNAWVNDARVPLREAQRATGTQSPSEPELGSALRAELDASDRLWAETKAEIEKLNPHMPKKVSISINDNRR